MSISLDMIIFENTMHCPKCKNTFLEEAFRRNPHTKYLSFEWYCDGVKVCKNMCNGCFSKKKSGDTHGYAHDYDYYAEYSKEYKIYLRKVEEAVEGAYQYHQDYIFEFSKKMHAEYDDLKKYRNGDESSQKKMEKIKNHWIYSFNGGDYLKSGEFIKNTEEHEPVKVEKKEISHNKEKTSKKCEKKDDIYDENTIKYINRFVNCSLPIAEAAKYKKEYEAYLSSIKGRIAYYEQKKKVNLSQDETHVIEDKLKEKNEEMNRVVISIEALKNTITHFFSL